jgi:hypothetical protein
VTPQDFPMLKALKENLSLLSLMVVLIGTSSTESYYGSFGLKYQLLSIPAAHILFRGLTAVWGFPLLALLYILALATAASQTRLAPLLGGVERLRWANHAAIAIFVVLAWAGGEYAGHYAANLDMKADTSSLPLISKIDLREGATEQTPSSPSQGYRLLLQTSEGLHFFKGVENPDNESPLIKFVPAEAIHALTICARC